MNNLDQLVTYKALEESRTSRNVGVLDHLLKDPHNAEKMGLKRIQFESLPELTDRLDACCARLHVSKREFLESVLVDALARAEQLFETVYRESTGRAYEEPSKC